MTASMTGTGGPGGPRLGGGSERRSLGHYGPPLWNIYDDSHNNAGDDIIILCDRGVGRGGICERFLPLQSRSAPARRTAIATLQLLNIRTWISSFKLHAASQDATRHIQIFAEFVEYEIGAVCADAAPPDRPY